MRGSSLCQPSMSTLSKVAMSVSLKFSPSKLIPSSVGSRPMGVSMASALPSQRLKIHSSTRAFSPKPGQTKPPDSSFLNQLT